MKTEFSTFADQQSKCNRLFIIYLKPKETQLIFTEPAGWFITDQTTHVQFHLLPSIHVVVPAEKIIFQYSDECYVFLSQTGFRTDEEHQDWLILCGKIPMLDRMDYLTEITMFKGSGTIDEIYQLYSFNDSRYSSS